MGTGRFNRRTARIIKENKWFSRVVLLGIGITIGGFGRKALLFLWEEVGEMGIEAAKRFPILKRLAPWVGHDYHGDEPK